MAKNIITTHYIKQDNLLPVLEFQFLDAETDLPIPLTGGVAQFKMEGPGGGLKINRAAVIDNALEGRGHFTWQAGDTDAPGRWPAEIEVTMPGALPFTGPNRINLIIQVARKVGG